MGRVKRTLQMSCPVNQCRASVPYTHPTLGSAVAHVKRPQGPQGSWDRAPELRELPAQPNPTDSCLCALFLSLLDAAWWLLLLRPRE